MSLRSKIEPAAINIERDITKCLTWHGFFMLAVFLETCLMISIIIEFKNKACISLGSFSEINKRWMK